MLCNVLSNQCSDDAWSQAQLGLKFGGLLIGLCSLSHHVAAAFIASLALAR